jgi:hypothetical protein
MAKPPPPDLAAKNIRQSDAVEKEDNMADDQVPDVPAID